MRHFLMLLASFFIFQSAHAFNIDVDVDGFIGNYQINGSGPWYSSNQTIGLPQGNYTLDLVFGGSVAFTVNSDGSVTSGDTDILTDSGSTLTFVNVDVDFNIGLYNHVYQFSCSNFQIASGTYRIPVKIVNALTIPPCNVSSTFTVDAGGYITILTGEEGFWPAGNELIFLPFRVDVNPQVYSGIYSFMGKNHMTGVSAQYFLPNATYQVQAETGASLGNFSTGANGIIPTSNNYFKAEDNLITFYSDQYTVTPPSGYSSGYSFYGHGGQNGVLDMWLVRGGPSWLNVQGVDYFYTATSDCTSFTISTAVGTFNLDCNNDAALYNDPVSEDGFNDIDIGFISKRYDGRFSIAIGDYTLTVNGSGVSLTGADLSRDTLHVPAAFSQGRNETVFDGEDEDGNPFTITKIFWVGGADVTVTTQGATDTVTLTVEQTINDIVYSQSVVQQAVSNTTIFRNIPQITNGVVYVSTTRSQKKILGGQLPKRSIIHL